MLVAYNAELAVVSDPALSGSLGDRHMYSKIIAAVALSAAFIAPAWADVTSTHAHSDCATGKCAPAHPAMSHRTHGAMAHGTHAASTSGHEGGGIAQEGTPSTSHSASGAGHN
jgi:uncharacterized protein involved in copper resistance